MSARGLGKVWDGVRSVLGMNQVGFRKHHVGPGRGYVEFIRAQMVFCEFC